MLRVSSPPVIRTSRLYNIDMKTGNITDSDKNLLTNMLAVPGFLTYDLEGKGIEVKPGRYSPVYVNMKTTWSYPDVLFPIAERLSDLCRGCDCVIGIETGGSPYASSISRDLKISLLLARKEAKEQMGVLAGYLNSEEKEFAVVDDVLATGRSSERGFLSVKSHDNKVRIVSVLSYGIDRLIAKKYGVEVRSLYQIDDLLNALDLELALKLTPSIRAYQEKLRGIINI